MSFPVADYIQKILKVPCDLPDGRDGILLWQFPEADFEAWRAFSDVPPLDSYSQYLMVLAAVGADAERRGWSVARTDVPVRVLLYELKKQGWPNDTPHRARAISSIVNSLSKQNGDTKQG